MDRAQKLYEMLMKFFAEEQETAEAKPKSFAKESMAPPGRMSDDDKRGAYQALIEDIAEEGPQRRGEDAIIEFIIMGMEDE
jgi:hypothetical protein